MSTIIIKSVMKEDVNSLQSSAAKEFKAALEQTLKEYAGQLQDFKVTKGTVTVTIDPDEACDKLLEELNSQGMEAQKSRPLAAFKNRYAAKESADVATTENK